MRHFVFTILFFFFGSIQFAQADSMKLASELGNLFASEKFCKLTYNADAIAKFIEEKVPADDLGFTGMLQTMTEGNKIQLSELSASGKVAHCLQTKRAAKSHGFIE